MSEHDQTPLKITGDSETPSGGRILIIEDDPDVRVTLVDLLEDAGYPVDCAANGQEALDHLRRGTLPSVILLDLMMPVMDGYEFYDQLQANSGWATIPVLVVSAAAREVNADSRLGAAPHVQKPFKAQQLLALIAHTSARGRAMTDQP
jgi:CheY-like chemotaxis protein